MEAKSTTYRGPAEGGGGGVGLNLAAGSDRAAAELRAALLIAHRYPRDETGALAKILRACQRPALAQEAIYALARAGRLSLSPSLRLARVMALAWGNLQLGTRELARTREQVQIEAFCWDLESNVREARTFEASLRPRAKLRVSDEPRRLAYESPAVAGARHERACILALIPQDVVEAALEQCERTLANLDGNISLDKRINELVADFETAYGVGRADLEELLGYSLDQAREPALVRLRAVLKALRDGFARREDFFSAKREGSRAAKGICGAAPQAACEKVGSGAQAVGGKPKAETPRQTPQD
jgi:hypothetical protein